MNWIGYPSTFCVFITLLVESFGQLSGQPTPAGDRISSSEIDPVALHEQATRALDTYCVTCHGPKKQKGDLRFDALDTMDAVDLQDLYSNMQEVIQLGEMPPEKAKQPKETEKKILLQWLES